jgi:hypothetical protein
MSETAIADVIDHGYLKPLKLAATPTYLQPGSSE